MRGAQSVIRVQMVYCLGAARGMPTMSQVRPPKHVLVIPGTGCFR